MEKYRFDATERSVLEQLTTPLAVYQLVDRRVATLVLSEGFCRMFGYPNRAEAYRYMEEDLYRDLHPDDVTRTANKAMRFAAEEAEYDVVYRARKLDGSGYHIIHAVGSHVYREDGVRLAYVTYMDEGAYTDDRNVQGAELNLSLNDALHEESILKANYYDYLTGLPSMTYFFELAESWRDRVIKEGREPALLFMNLGGMKFFNHKFGFAEGDLLLKAVSKILSSHFTAGNCSRINADHFAVFTEADGLEEKLSKVIAEVQEANGGNSLPLRVGIYLNRMGEVQVSTACDRAKFACDSLKKTYASGFRYYDQHQRDDEERRRYILSNLDRAIRERWIRVYFQPIVRAVNGRASDDEALSRWIDPVRGLLSPADFVPVLEEAQVIYKLDLYVLDRVLEKLKLEEQTGAFMVPQSINLSRSDFDACDIVEEVRARVDAAGVRRDMITIEITESALGSDFDFMKEQVERFRALGFPVWMDDFGSGYSSLDLLQSIRFDLIKFDMGFMRKLDDGDNGKIILTELVKMATSLGIDTVCEGVETAEQAEFLQEIGCSKMQGFYYAKPAPLAQDPEASGRIGYENPEESPYYEAIGRVNLFDLAVIANEEGAFRNVFNTLPMGIIEILPDGRVCFTRSNRSYREFMLRFYHCDIAKNTTASAEELFGKGSAFLELIRSCCDKGNRAFFDEKMADGTVVHFFARRIDRNPLTGTTAVALAVFSITGESEGTTYADIARALASDYYNIYYVNLETDDFIEYSSPVGREGMAMERHGKDFFGSSLRDAGRIYEDDRKVFFDAFTKENIVRELDRQGVFTATYRLVDTGEPMYAGMKVVRTRPNGKHIVVGISIIDARMRQKMEEERIRQERVTYGRIKALAGDFIALYTVNPVSGAYFEYSASPDYEQFGFEKKGEDFFLKGIEDGKKTVYPGDLSDYLRGFTRENVLRKAREEGLFTMRYRLMLEGAPTEVCLKAALVQERDGEKLIVGVNRVDAERRNT